MVLVESYATHSHNWLQCFDSADMSDVVIEGKDGRPFHCHKLVLAVASPYFKNLFYCGDENCSQKFITQKDVEPGALKWILRACYTGDGDLNDDNVISVMIAAKMFEIDWVEQACMKFLRGQQGKPFASFEYSKENEQWQKWVVPETDWYHIVVLGAKAGDGAPVSHMYTARGGEGAILGASFELKAKDVVHILTGGMSRMYEDPKYPNYYTGGGGGTFVALNKQSLSLLLAAGGGGGINLKIYGCDANLTEEGVGLDAKSMGGKNGGNGGGHNIHIGGLGWKAGPVALTKPSGKALQNGGFGGGGAGCGGGGGYSGGSAGWDRAGAGGGGSYVAPEAKNVWKKIGSSSHGKVFVWRGKEPPSHEMFFLKHIGDITEGSPTNGEPEPINSWEILD